MKRLVSDVEQQLLRKRLEKLLEKCTSESDLKSCQKIEQTTRGHGDDGRGFHLKKKED